MVPAPSTTADSSRGIMPPTAGSCGRCPWPDEQVGERFRDLVDGQRSVLSIPLREPVAGRQDRDPGETDIGRSKSAGGDPVLDRRTPARLVGVAPGDDLASTILGEGAELDLDQRQLVAVLG